MGLDCYFTVIYIDNKNCRDLGRDIFVTIEIHLLQWGHTCMHTIMQISFIIISTPLPMRRVFSSSTGFILIPLVVNTGSEKDLTSFEVCFSCLVYLEQCQQPNCYD